MEESKYYRSKETPSRASSGKLDINSYFFLECFSSKLLYHENV